MNTQHTATRVFTYCAAAVGLLLAASSAPASYQTTVLADNPIAFYALNPGTDGTTTAPDLTANGNDGNEVGISTATGPSPYITNAANFNGASAIDLSQGANAGILNFSGPITLEVWAQPASATEFADLLAKGYDSSTYQEIVIRLNGPYGGNFYGSSGSAGENGGGQTTGWSHVVLTSDGTNCSLYVNGGLAARSPDTAGSIQFSDDWVIGDGSSGGSGRPFNGNLTEVAIYNHGLTPAQIQTHYNMGMYGTATVASTGRSLEWASSGNSGVWDTGTSANWLNLSGNTSTVFDAGDQVLFGDLAGEPTAVNINSPVNPNSVTVNSSANAYSMSGSGSLTGTGGLSKQGSSTLTLNPSCDLSGPLSVTGGTVVAGTSGFNSFSSVTVTNNSTIDFGGAIQTAGNPMTVSGAGVNGEGVIYNTGGAQYGQVMNITMAGDTTFGQNPSGNSRWDLAAGSSISGPHHLLLDWAGGSYGEWNTINIGADVIDITLTNGNLGSKNLDNAFANTGTMFYVSPGQQLVFYSGGFNGSITAGAGATLTDYNGGVNFNGNIIHLGSGVTFYLYGAGIGLNGSSFILENNVFLASYYNGGVNNINNAVTLNGIVHFIIGDHSMVYSSLISGPGGFVLDQYNNDLVMETSNTYTGPTVIGSISNSPVVALTGDGSMTQSPLIFFGGTDFTTVHVDASGRNDGTFTLASGQTLAGIGSILGDLTVSAGATLTPGGSNTTIGITTGANPTGTIAASGNVALDGMTTIKLDGSGSNDVVEAGGSVTYGGTLNLENISGAPLAVANSWQVFVAAGLSGGFSSVTPATPGAGLAWDFSQLNNGIVGVIAGTTPPTITSTKLQGSDLVISGNGGAPGASYILLATTNLTTPLAQWTPIATNNYDTSGNFSATNAIAPGSKQLFYIIK